MNSLLTLAPYLAVVIPNMTHFVIVLVIILLICGLVAFLISKAPWIADPYKTAILWLLLAVPVVYVIMFLLTFV